MKEKDIISFLQKNIDPISDVYSKKAYRTAVYLNDEIYLPCVIFRKTSDIVDLAIKRFEEIKGNGSKNFGYRDIVETFVANKNCIESSNIEKVIESPYAIPSKFYTELWKAGETSMSWISFIANMDNGKSYWFGTSFPIEFFNMPEGYSAKNIINIEPHKSLEGICYKPKPYFDCYLNTL